MLQRMKERVTRVLELDTRQQQVVEEHKQIATQIQTIVEHIAPTSAVPTVVMPTPASALVWLCLVLLLRPEERGDDIFLCVLSEWDWACAHTAGNSCAHSAAHSLSRRRD